MLLLEHNAKTKMVSSQGDGAKAGIDKFEIKKTEGSFAHV
jgi:hypothetical protein